MNVRVHILFDTPGPDELAAITSLGRRLTDCPEKVRVFAEEKSRWLVAEFTMPTEAQYKAVPKIDHELRILAGNWLDSTIEFPKTEAERARARRKAEQRRARRRKT